jgi:hypothetical protein
MRDDLEEGLKETLRRRGVPDPDALERLSGHVDVLPPRRPNRLRNLSLAASIVVLLGVVLLARPRDANIGKTLASPSDGAAVPSGQISSPSAGASLTDNTRVTCGGQMTFPASGLDAPLGAEKASGPEFDALRAAFALYAGPFPEAPDWSWRLAGRDDSGATFMAKPEGFGASEWISIELAASPGGWHPTGIGVCLPHVVLSAEFGPATWGLDLAFPPPEAASTELHVLVSERACHGFEPATGRMSAPAIVYTPESVTVTIGVRPLGGASTCPKPPGTPTLIQLAEPLGDRTLLDGGTYPPAPP